MIVNGKEHDSEARTALQLLTELGYDRDLEGVALAVNGAVLRRAEWDSHALTQDDRVEIVGAVQGG